MPIYRLNADALLPADPTQKSCFFQHRFMKNFRVKEVDSESDSKAVQVREGWESAC